MAIIGWLHGNNSSINSGMCDLLKKEVLWTFLCMVDATFLFEMFDIILEKNLE